MKLICKCGNILNLNQEDGSTIEGFEFLLEENTDDLIIHCNKCDKAVVLSNPEEVED